MPDASHSGALRAPGKMFWIGEYAVLFEGPALVAAVDRYARASYELHAPAAGGSLRITSTHCPLPLVLQTPGPRGESETDADWLLVDSVIDTLHRELPGFETPHGTLALDSTTLQSDTKLGLGSSGAIAVLTTAALTARDPLPREEIERLALEAHHQFQGRTGSGGDVIASSRGGLTRISGKDRSEVEIPRSLYCGALYTGVSASTPKLVSKMKAAAGRDHRVRDLLERMAAISEDAIEALRADDLTGWMSMIREFHSAERALTKTSGVGVVTEEVQRCVQLAEDFGCAAKASGAGGGDVVVAFANDPAALHDLKRASESAGLAYIDLHLDRDGLKPLTLSETLRDPSS